MVPNWEKLLIQTFSDCMKYPHVLTNNDAGMNPPFKYQNLTNQMKNKVVDHNSNCDIIDYLRPISCDDNNNYFFAEW